MIHSSPKDEVRACNHFIENRTIHNLSHQTANHSAITGPTIHRTQYHAMEFSVSTTDPNSFARMVKKKYCRLLPGYNFDLAKLRD